MTPLLALVREIAEKKGPLSVAAYMELALQHPEFGYYRQKDPLGRTGDFITAPEISQMFGEMIGLWCADVWRQMGKPERFALLELGPGRGTLMQDALRATARITGFHAAMNLHLLESNKTLRAAQWEKLSAHVPVHMDDLTELPAMPTIVIANEFFDALPVRQFEKNFQGWCERLISVADDRLAFTLWPLDEPLLQFIPAHLREANPGTIYEVSLPSMPMVRTLAKHIVQQSGAMLMIDYGFVEPAGLSTLQAVSDHGYVDVLERPGEVDLTAHVDFGMLRTVAAGAGVKVMGPIGQGAFLQALGIDLRAAQLKREASSEQVATLDAALHRLTDASQMGNLFKAMAVASPSLSELAGF